MKKSIVVIATILLLLRYMQVMCTHTHFFIHALSLNSFPFSPQPADAIVGNIIQPMISVVGQTAGHVGRGAAVAGGQATRGAAIAAGQATRGAITAGGQATRGAIMAGGSGGRGALAAGGQAVRGASAGGGRGVVRQMTDGIRQIATKAKRVKADNKPFEDLGQTFMANLDDFGKTATDIVKSGVKTTNLKNNVGTVMKKSRSMPDLVEKTVQLPRAYSSPSLFSPGGGMVNGLTRVNKLTAGIPIAGAVILGGAAGLIASDLNSHIKNDGEAGANEVQSEKIIDENGEELSPEVEKTLDFFEGYITNIAHFLSISPMRIEKLAPFNKFFIGGIEGYRNKNATVPIKSDDVLLFQMSEVKSNIILTNILRQGVTLFIYEAVVEYEAGDIDLLVAIDVMHEYVTPKPKPAITAVTKPETTTVPPKQTSSEIATVPPKHTKATTIESPYPADDPNSFLPVWPKLISPKLISPAVYPPLPRPPLPKVNYNTTRDNAKACSVSLNSYFLSICISLFLSFSLSLPQ
jgi:hypothetical protein